MRKLGAIIIILGVLLAVYFFLYPTAKEKGKLNGQEKVSVTSKYWHAIIPMDHAKYGAQAAVLNGKIYVVGGKLKETGDFLNVVEIYDPEKKEWNEGPPINVARAKFALVSHKGKLYIFGGENKSGVVREVEEFDPSKGKWEIVDEMPSPRASLSGISYKGKIHLIGGEDPQNLSNYGDYDIYDPLKKEWKKGAPLPLPRHAAALVVFKDKLYIVGGWSRELNQPLGDVSYYNEKDKKWYRATPLIYPVYAAGFGVIGDRLYVVGGFSDPSGEAPLASLQVFDGTKWIEGERMPTPRGWVASVVLNGSLYIIGGTTGFESLELVEVFKPQKS